MSSWMLRAFWGLILLQNEKLRPGRKAKAIERDHTLLHLSAKYTPNQKEISDALLSPNPIAFHPRREPYWLHETLNQVQVPYYLSLSAKGKLTVDLRLPTQLSVWCLASCNSPYPESEIKIQAILLSFSFSFRNSHIRWSQACPQVFDPVMH